MSNHRLSPLLAPKSIAVVGASVKPNTPGNDVLHMLVRGGFEGDIYPVNPNYDSVAGIECHPSLAAVSKEVDLAVLVVANGRLERSLQEAANCGARSAVIFASGYLPDQESPPLLDRLRTIAMSSNMPICGGNCMGFYNEMSHTWVCGFPSPRRPRLGGITLISHAGSVFGVLAHNDPRLHFNLVVSSGQEIVTTAADYMDYALETPGTKVIGLFLESVRDPAPFLVALQRAAEKGVPVVALKIGRTEASAAMALSHSGAMAGNDAAYEAAFERYGVIRVDDIDEMASTLLLFQSGRRAVSGEVVAIHDSGGEREMVMDLASDYGVPFATIGANTVAVLRETLDYGLEPVNPLDAWGTGEDFVAKFHRCLTALVSDRSAGIGVCFHDLRDGSYISKGLAHACIEAQRETEKPVVMVTNYSQVRHDELAGVLVDSGVPVLDGTVAGLKALRNMLAFRDASMRPPDPPPDSPRAGAGEPRWPCDGMWSEAAAWELLRAYGIGTPPHAMASSEQEAIDAAVHIGLPVAIKTAMPGIAHKTEVSGVRLALNSREAVGLAYREISHRLGSIVLVSAMAPKGVELALGLLHSPFGPVVMLAAGGTLIEQLNDARYALAPFGTGTATRLINGLRCRALLDGWRGSQPVDLVALARVIANFSRLAADLADRVRELDVNPIIASGDGIFAVDALVVSKEG